MAAHIVTTNNNTLAQRYVQNIDYRFPSSVSIIIASCYNGLFYGSMGSRLTYVAAYKKWEIYESYITS
jgi:ABC-type taurine transport system substrate-binding protein